MRYVMDGSSFTILNETPCADPHAGCCGGWGLETPGYPIKAAIEYQPFDDDWHNPANID